jgi:NAD+ kinase
VKALALVGLAERPRAATVASEVIGWCEGQGLSVRLAPALAKAVNRPDLAVEGESLIADAGLLVALGGDGSVLGAARMAAPHGVPVLGANLGTFGFLTEIAAGDLMEALPSVVAGEHEVVERMMLQAQVLREGKVVHRMTALNDVVLGKGTFSRLVRMKVSIDNEHLATFLADGIIVSTPTGSTAYSLSAGGPVADPDMKMLIVAAICAHTLSARPLVMSSERRVQVAVETAPAPEQELAVTVDGQVSYQTLPEDVLRVGRAPFAAAFVDLGRSSFYERLRTKLLWAETGAPQAQSIPGGEG